MAVKKRLIPVLLSKRGKVVKGRKFRSHKYVGDLVNTVLMFSELEVDEIIVLDIDATRENTGPNFEILEKVVHHCSVPLTYGGGIRDIETFRRVLRLGVEKAAINSEFITNPQFAKNLSEEFGSQAVVASLDLRFDRRGQLRIWNHVSRKQQSLPPEQYALDLEEAGVGEFLFTLVDTEGTWEGIPEGIFIGLTKHLSVPWIAHGGLASAENLKSLLLETSCSGVGVGSRFIFQAENRGVLVGIPPSIRDVAREFG